jgi:predicted short-subunit dehydrogenase-like oxidoreductase (DUF2520 family)
MNIVLIGAGNVATHLGTALQSKGHSIAQVYSRTSAAAQTLADRLQTGYTCRLETLIATADVYFFALADDALPLVLKDFPPVKGLCLHTAGSVPLSVFDGSGLSRTGVFYPLQTFSKSREVSFDHIPVCLEISRSDDRPILEQLARTLSDTVLFLSSEKRKQLHLAAVFASNFANHLWGIAYEILQQHDIDPQILLPLITETAAKLQTLSPPQAQTGPAVRHDDALLRQHLRMLEDQPTPRALYALLSQSIQDRLRY